MEQNIHYSEINSGASTFDVGLVVFVVNYYYDHQTMHIFPIID
jgi:hypothetical protein